MQLSVPLPLNCPPLQWCVSVVVRLLRHVTKRSFECRPTVTEFRIQQQDHRSPNHAKMRSIVPAQREQSKVEMCRLQGTFCSSEAAAAPTLELPVSSTASSAACSNKPISNKHVHLFITHSIIAYILEHHHKIKLDLCKQNTLSPHTQPNTGPQPAHRLHTAPHMMMDLPGPAFKVRVGATPGGAGTKSSGQWAARNFGCAAAPETGLHGCCGSP